MTMTSYEAEKVIFQSHEQLEAVTVIVWVYTLKGGRTHAHVHHGGIEIYLWIKFFVERWNDGIVGELPS